MATTDKLNVQITADASQFNRQIKSIQSQLTSTAKTTNKQFTEVQKSIQSSLTATKDSIDKSLGELNTGLPADKLAASFGRATRTITREGVKSAKDTETAYTAIDPNTDKLSSGMSSTFNKMVNEAQATGKQISQALTLHVTSNGKTQTFKDYSDSIVEQYTKEFKKIQKSFSEGLMSTPVYNVSDDLKRQLTDVMAIVRKSMKDVN